MLDAKAQELAGMQQQVEQGKSELAGKADSIRADMQRLQMEKQLAEAEVKTARDQLTNRSCRRGIRPRAESRWNWISVRRT